MADWSSPAALRLTADIARHPDLGTAIAEVLGAPLPAPGHAGAGIIAEGPGDWLVLRDDPAGLGLRLEALGPVVATPAALAEFHLTADQLASGTAVCPAPGDAAVTRFAQLRVTVLAEADHFRLLVDVPVARHIALWLSR